MPAGAGFVGLSADSWMAINEETTYGTRVGPTSGEYFLFLSESLKADRPLIPVPNIASAYRDANQKFAGATVVGGDVELVCTYESMENLLLHAFGEIANAASGASGSYSRDFDLSAKGRYKNANSPALSIHISRGVVGSGASNPTVFSYEGCVVDSFEFTCSRDQPLKMKATIFGEDESIQVVSVTPSYPSSPVINFAECVVTWGGTQIPMTDFTLTVNRSVDKDRRFLGSLLTSEPPMGQYEVTFSGNTEWDNENRVGTNTLRADHVAQTNRALLLTFTSAATITGTSIKYKWIFNMPAAYISQFSPNVSGRGRVMVPITFTPMDSTVTSAPHELRLSTVNARNFSE